MKRLRVFGVNLDGRKRGIVAATSQRAAADALGTTLSNLRTYGSETWNPREVELALSTPGKPWRRAIADLSDSAAWEQFEPDRGD